jgi:hypothetical protein
MISGASRILFSLGKDNFDEEVLSYLYRVF